MVNTTPSQVVIDIDMLAMLFAGLYQERDLFHSLQFSSLAEAVVLHDELIIATTVEDVEPSQDEAEGRKLVQELLSDWVNANAVSFQSLDAATAKRGTDELAVSTRAHKTPQGPDAQEHVINADEDSFGMLVVQAGRVLVAERSLERAASLLPLQQLFYEMSANVKGDHAICDLTGHYASLASALVDLRKTSRINPLAYEVIPIPPVGYEVFERSRSLDGLFQSVLEVRERFTDLRARLSSLQSLLDDPTESLREKIRHQRRWAAAWSRLHDEYTRPPTMGLATTNTAIYKAAPEIPGVLGLNPSSWIKLLSSIVDAVPELWGRWRLRALHRSFEEYLDAADADLGTAIGKVLGRDITNDEASEMSEVVDLMKQLANAAVAVFLTNQSRVD